MDRHKMNDLLRKIDIYVGNTSIEINQSAAKPEVKKLISDVRNQTAELIAAIIHELP